MKFMQVDVYMYVLYFVQRDVVGLIGIRSKTQIRAEHLLIRLIPPYWDISHSNQYSITGVRKAVVCTVQSEELCIELIAWGCLVRVAHHVVAVGFFSLWPSSEYIEL